MQPFFTLNGARTMDETKMIDEILTVFETMKQERLKRSCSRDALIQANAFETAIAVINKIRKEYEQRANKS